MPGYFTNGKKEQDLERMMQEKPGKSSQRKIPVSVIVRCENCSFYHKERRLCRLPTCRYEAKKTVCEGCAYGNGICNVCYKEILGK